MMSRYELAMLLRNARFSSDPKARSQAIAAISSYFGCGPITDELKLLFPEFIEEVYGKQPAEKAQ